MSPGPTRSRSSANRTPIAVTGAYSICQDGSIQLNGTASADPDAACADSIVSYEWDLNNDTTFDITGATPTVTYTQLTSLGLVVGSNVIKLRVTDTHAAVDHRNRKHHARHRRRHLLGRRRLHDRGRLCVRSLRGSPGCSGELQNARSSDKMTLVWDSLPTPPIYDVLRGAVSALPVGPGGGDELCFDS